MYFLSYFKSTMLCCTDTSDQWCVQYPTRHWLMWIHSINFFLSKILIGVNVSMSCLVSVSVLHRYYENNIKVTSTIEIINSLNIFQLQLLGCLAGVEMILRDVGYPVKLGSGVAAASAYLQNNIPLIPSRIWVTWSFL